MEFCRIIGFMFQPSQFLLNLTARVSIKSNPSILLFNIYFNIYKCLISPCPLRTTARFLAPRTGGKHQQERRPSQKRTTKFARPRPIHPIWFKIPVKMLPPTNCRLYWKHPPTLFHVGNAQRPPQPRRLYHAAPRPVFLHVLWLKVKLGQRNP